MCIRDRERSGGRGSLTLSGVTDNLGNRFAVSKLMTTKFPLCAAMMQLSSTLSQRHMKLRLNWAPREQNYEADELSNGIKHRFSREKQVDVEKILKDLPVFNKMIKYGRSLYEGIKDIKEDKKRKRDEAKEDKPIKGTAGRDKGGDQEARPRILAVSPGSDRGD